MRRVLGDLLGGKPPWDAEPGALDLFRAACVASSVGEEECDRIYEKCREAMVELTLAEEVSKDRYKPVAEAAREVLGRFELRGRCLVERGVGVEDPAVCEGGADGGLLIVGSRMQFFVDGEARTTVARAGDLCAVAIDRGELDDWALRELKAGRTGLLKHDGVAALISVRGCRVEDMPRLAERAAKMPYREIFESCVAFGDEGAESEALSKAEELELNSCLELLGVLERGGGS